MKKLFAAALAVSLTAAAAASYPVFEENVEPRTFETENYRFHLVESHGQTGGELQPLVHVDQNEKRDMVLALDVRNSPRKTCNILYENSLTRHGNPCNALP